MKNERLKQLAAGLIAYVAMVHIAVYRWFVLLVHFEKW
jgi:hypothetical protein